jgi:hypothetical protein
MARGLFRQGVGVACGLVAGEGLPIAGAGLTAGEGETVAGGAGWTWTATPSGRRPTGTVPVTRSPAVSQTTSRLSVVVM